MYFRSSLISTHFKISSATTGIASRQCGSVEEDLEDYLCRREVSQESIVRMAALLLLFFPSMTTYIKLILTFF